MNCYTGKKFRQKIFECDDCEDVDNDMIIMMTMIMKVMTKKGEVHLFVNTWILNSRLRLESRIH